MEENETIRLYHAKVRTLLEEKFILREKIPKEKLIGKVLRTLLERFAYKFATIGEAKNLETMKLEELIGSIELLK